MKLWHSLLAAALLIACAAWAQLRVTSFKSNGDLTWTNSAMVGLYKVEWANAASGPWYAFDSQTSLNAIRQGLIGLSSGAGFQPTCFLSRWVDMARGRVRRSHVATRRLIPAQLNEFPPRPNQ